MLIHIESFIGAVAIAFIFYALFVMFVCNDRIYPKYDQTQCVLMCNACTEDFFEELGISNRLIKQAIDRNKDEN